jgi:ribosomal protein S18 acetylase RimI-like enzyme
VTEPIALRPSEASQAARVLTRAFADDEAWRTIFPADAVRAAVLPRLWRAVVGYSLRYGEVRTTPDVAGVACALGPGRAFVTPWCELRTGLRFSRLIASLSFENRRSFLFAAVAIDRLHHQAMPGPHEYLWALGVDTARQGAGTGSALVGAFVTRADEACLPAYLETETERNGTERELLPPPRVRCLARGARTGRPTPSVGDDSPASCPLAQRARRASPDAERWARAARG